MTSDAEDGTRLTALRTIIAIALSGMVGSRVAGADGPALASFDTGYTISKVRTALRNGKSYVVASSYEGTVLGIGYDGTVLCKNALSGFMNRDLWCGDISGDGSDAILVGRPVKMVDLLDQRRFIVGNTSPVEIDVPRGMFRFIDIETEDPIAPARRARSRQAGDRYESARPRLSR